MEVSDQILEMYRKTNLEPSPDLDLPVLWRSLDHNTASEIAKDSLVSLLCRISHICLSRVERSHDEPYSIHLQHLIFMLRNMGDVMRQDTSLNQVGVTILTQLNSTNLILASA